MNVTATALSGVMVIEPTVHADTRGWFMETWNAERFGDAGLPSSFLQDNHSCSERGVLRGLHYQTEFPQGKLVRVVSGEVFDVAVDLRGESPTLGRWVGVRLSGDNRRQLWIPPGFAHGFYVTSGPAQVLYKVTGRYSPSHERTLRWDDPHVAIDWPVPSGGAPILSAKDAVGEDFAASALYEAP